MTEKVYVVLEGQKYTGKHRVYEAGQKFAEAELFGDLEMALKGHEKSKTKPKIKEVKSSVDKKAEAK